VLLLPQSDSDRPCHQTRSTAVEKLDYKFDTYEKASDQVLRLATIIIIAAVTVAVLPSTLQAVTNPGTQPVATGQGGLLQARSP
jgi:hypothetical protein